MKYKPTHKRKVRGKTVHDTIQEGKAKETKRKIEQRLEKLREKEWHTEQELFRTVRKTVEAKYLTPEVEHFVETPRVKEITDRVKLWLKIGYPVHIIGPTGCGKTTIAMHVANELGRPVVWINGDEQVTTTDLIGGYSQVETESLRDKYIHNVFKNKDILKADWVDNPLTLACKHGYTLVYNEFSRTLPVANNILLSVFEEKILELPTKFGEERYIKVNPNFTAILTSNSVDYAGVHRPQDALLDRLIGVYMDYYDFDTEVRVVQAHINIPRERAERIVRIIRALRDRLPDGEKPGTRACIMMAQGLQALNEYNKENLEKLCVDIMATKTKGAEDLINKRSMVSKVLRGV